MKEIKNVKSSVRPVEIDDTSSETIVYMRYNITEQEEIDPVFNTTKTVYVYDETQYTLAEWYRLCMRESNARIKNLEIIVKDLSNKLGISIDL